MLLYLICLSIYKDIKLILLTLIPCLIGEKERKQNFLCLIARKKNRKNKNTEENFIGALSFFLFSLHHRREIQGEISLECLGEVASELLLLLLQKYALYCPFFVSESLLIFSFFLFLSRGLIITTNYFHVK